MSDARFVLVSLMLAACGGSPGSIHESDSTSEDDAALSDGHLGVTCSPHDALAYPGDELLLRANVRGSSNKKVSWQATAGNEFRGVCR